MRDPTRLAEIRTIDAAEEQQSGRSGQVSNDDASQDRDPSALKAYNDFLIHELSSIERERDALRGDLRRLRHSFGWKLIERYREWLDDMLWRHNRIAEPFERMASWVLSHLTGRASSDDDRGYQLWMAERRLTPDQISRINAEIEVFPHKPLITVILQVDGNAVQRWLTTSIKSVSDQLYPAWELRIVTRGQVASGIAAHLDMLANGDHRIRVESLPRQDHISLAQG